MLTMYVRQYSRAVTDIHNIRLSHHHVPPSFHCHSVALVKLLLMPLLVVLKWLCPPVGVCCRKDCGSVSFNKDKIVALFHD